MPEVFIAGVRYVVPISPPSGDAGDNLKVNTYIWNSQNLAWEASTGGGGEVTGTVEVSNFPATQPVSGSVSVSNLPETQPISGSVSVSNLPETQPVSGSVAVSGSVNVGNFPATQPMSAAALPLPSGAATSAYQATLESLIETLQELNHRLAPLGGAVAMVGGQSLRTLVLGTAAVSGPQTSAEFIAAHHLGGRNYPIAVALHNIAAQANINNVTAA